MTDQAGSAARWSAIALPVTPARRAVRDVVRGRIGVLEIATVLRTGPPLTRRLAGYTRTEFDPAARRYLDLLSREVPALDPPEPLNEATTGGRPS